MRWRDPDWFAEAHAWIEARVGGSITGLIEQPHVRPWSTVMRVPTAEGDLWFKANAPIHLFEAGLALELARVCPDRVAELVAADPDRGWMLMRDAGTRLREITSGADQLAHWERLLPLYAELQLALAPRAGELLALGVPDTRLEGLAARLERLLLERPEGLTSDELDRLRSAVPEVAAMCSELAAYGVAETIQHDDFHDGQVFVRRGRYRFLDWGDSCVSHPFHSLTVTLRAFAYKHGLQPGGPELARLRDAYLEPFGRAGLAAAADLAFRTGTIARALAWHNYEWDAEAVPYGLKLFLAGGPIGSWDPR